MKYLILATAILGIVSAAVSISYREGRSAGISSVEMRLAERRVDAEALKLSIDTCLAWRERYEEMEELITRYFDAEDEIRAIKARGF